MSEGLTCSDILATRAAPIQVAMSIFDAMAVDPKHWPAFQRLGPILAAAVITTVQDQRFADLTVQALADEARSRAAVMLAAAGAEGEWLAEGAQIPFRLAIARAVTNLRRGFNAQGDAS